MTTLYRVRTVLTGFLGGPGVSTAYTLAAPGDLADLSAFWGQMALAMPNVVHIQVEGTGDTIEDTTGALTGSWTGTTPAEHVGADGGRYAGGVGAVVNWLTGTVLAGHRVRGRTFIVPLLGGHFDADGTLTSTDVSAIGSAARTLVAAEAGNFVVWHRPRAARAAVGTPGTPGFRPAVSARVGGNAVITGATVPDRSAILRSRRD